MDYERNQRHGRSDGLQPDDEGRLDRGLSQPYPPAVFLIATRVERRPANARFPNGFARVPSLAFVIAATALTALGATLLIDSAISLILQEHSTVAAVHIGGREIWLGWIMVSVQIYSIIVPMVLGWLKLPLARQIYDKTLFTDAMTHKANWMTGIARICGVIGIGLGYWWADALAAGLISIDILIDGIRALRAASAELIDGAPMALDSTDIAKVASALQAALNQQCPDAEVHLRETGRVINAQIIGAVPPKDTFKVRDYWPGGLDYAWRLGRISFVPPTCDHGDGNKGQVP